LELRLCRRQAQQTRDPIDVHADLIAILILIPALAFVLSLALGDSLALGFGRASHLPTSAVVGEPSYKNRKFRGIVNMVPTGHFDFVLLSAGTNDVPGNCIEAIRAKLDATVVEWIVPVNSARAHVLRVAKAYGDKTYFYQASKKRGVWPHRRAT
jgi:hypothetical protein